MTITFSQAELDNLIGERNDMTAITQYQVTELGVEDPSIRECRCTGEEVVNKETYSTMQEENMYLRLKNQDYVNLYEKLKTRDAKHRIMIAGLEERVDYLEKENDILEGKVINRESFIKSLEATVGDLIDDLDHINKEDA